MKKCLIVLMVVFLLCSGSAMAFNANSNGGEINANGPCGPAPHSGDGIPDGSGMDGAFQGEGCD